ncbi:MAG TPA: PfkB family carbohydrate kinase [Nitrospiria bacterium]|nr:PfkB family carbohydrate kinase [Nitrospiria bacterium]
MSLLVVGSVAFDSVKTPFGEVEEVLGGSATYFSAAASFFAPVSVVAVVGEDFPDNALEFLKSRQVRLEGLERRPGKTFRWKGEYGFQLNEARTLDTQLNVFQEFRPTLPETYKKSPYVFLANIDPDLQMRVLEQVERPKIVAADTMNFWIEGKREALIRTLKQVDILIINDGEARELAREVNLVKAARTILSYGPKRVIVKRGEYGALMFDGRAVFAAPAYPLETVFDPTGAGDSFAGGFMGYLAKNGALSDAGVRQAVIYGSVMASFNVESFSLDRLKRLKLDEVEERYRAFRELTRFENV